MNFARYNGDGSYSQILMNTSEEVKQYVEREYRHPHSYRFVEWNPKLFGMEQKEIISFLENRFYETKNPIEWLILLPYLRKIVPDSEIYTPFEARKERSISNSNGSMPTLEKTSNRIEQDKIGFAAIKPLTKFLEG